mmetsp:Transcript_51465/g.111631  ORF Transcript_51465/g.111631 Transcript_51465/m.111631 type:complete len:235 (-) Transcript_51465:104-808(-)
MLIDAVVVHVGEDHIAVRALRSSGAEVRKVLLQDAASARGREEDQIGLVLFVLPRDVVDNLLLGASGQDMPVDDARRHWGEVSLPLQHASHHVEVVVAERSVHDGMHVLEGGSHAERADVSWTCVHPVRELHATSHAISSAETRRWGLREKTLSLRQRSCQKSRARSLADEGAEAMRHLHLRRLSRRRRTAPRLGLGCGSCHHGHRQEPQCRWSCKIQVTGRQPDVGLRVLRYL